MDDSIFDDSNRQKMKWAEQKMFVIRQCLQAVAYLHQLDPPIIHRGSKPVSALISYDNIITKISDLGIGKMQGLVTLTCTVIGRQPPGTAIYMAPELLVKTEQATIESDMWSLAITFLEFDAEIEAWESSDDQNEFGDCI